MMQVQKQWIAAGVMLAVVCTLSGCGIGSRCGWSPCSCTSHRSLAIPDTYPLGSVNRAHYHTMEANGEAADFILHRSEFVGNTAELTPFGKDHIVEIAARMRNAPFPVLIERSENNSDPELDDHRRRIIAQILTDFGAPEADQRTIVSPAYGKGINSREGEAEYYRFISSRGFGNFAGGFGNNGVGGGFGGSFGGGGFGF
jgi:uncharacterized membrane protein YgcG